MASFQVPAPDRFDFTTPETWTKWVQRFERFKSASGLGEKSGVAQVNTLIYSMGPEADDIFASFDLSEDDRKKFDEVKKSFDDYFIVRRNVIYERAKFNIRKQEEGESVESFITSLYTLSEHCGYNDLKDQMIRDRIVVGIKDSNLSLKMQLDAGLTLKKAIDMARQSESVKKQQSLMRSDGLNSSTNVDAVKSKSTKRNWKNQPKIQQSAAPKSKGCQRCGNRHSHSRHKCPAKDAKCYKCTNIGHYAKYCNTKTKTLSSVSEEVSEGFLGTVEADENKAWTIKLRANNKKDIDFKIDTGADVTCISEKEYKSLGKGQNLQKTHKRLSGPGNFNLHVTGKFYCMLESNHKMCIQEIYVIRDLNKLLLGRPAIKALNIIDRVNVSSVDEKVGQKHVKDASFYRGKFPKVFSGLGKTNWTYTIKLSADAKPYALSTPRRVPLPLMEKVKLELQRMEKLGVITKQDEPTEWCAGMVVVPKASGDVRICIDFTKLNQSVKRENYPLPCVEESLAKLAGAKIFTKLDANSSFWQTNLAKESRPLTTFITPFGRYSCNRLPFGLNSASEFFQKRMSETLEGFEGVLCHMDDVLVFGASQDEHNERLDKVLRAIERAGLTLNQKCEFSKTSVKFLGQIIDDSGCKMDPEKVRAIVEMSRPTDVSGIRWFLGMVNQLNKFSPKITELTKPLRELLKMSNAWLWGPDQESAFNEIKKELRSSGLLKHYDPSKETVVSADASSYGLGAVIRQRHGEMLKPIAYASRSMTETEQRYAQIEREALGLVWACEKFSNYLIGMKFKLETDHKPLVPLLSTKSISDLPPRIQRFRMRLMRFDFSISHVPGKDLNIPDALSRASVEDLSDQQKEFASETKVNVDSIVKNFPASDRRLNEIRVGCEKDAICSQLIEYCKTGWPEISSMVEKLKPYHSLQGEISIVDGLLLKGDRLVIPESMQTDILECLHGGHQGIQKCRERAKGSVWWLGLNAQLENLVKGCQKCIENSRDQAEPLLQTEFPKFPWQRVASDIFDLKGENYLLVVDYYSRYIEIAKLHSMSSQTVINHLKSIFARHGIPEIFMSDNGPQYSSSAFKMFEKEFNFQHVTSSPHYPQSNGLAERSVQTVKNMLRKTNDLSIALLSYRTTPLANGYSPSQLLMGRKLRNLVPVLPRTLQPKLPVLGKLKECEKSQRVKQKFYYDKRHRARTLTVPKLNDRVWIKDQRKVGILKKIENEPRSFKIETDTGEIRRNRRHFSNMNKVKPEFLSSDQEISFDTSPAKCSIPEQDQNETHVDQSNKSEFYVTRSGRISKPPSRLDL